jgi:pyruvate formate lyase activating enzyme
MNIESLLYQKLDNKKVRCKTCSHRCYINNGKYGFCGVRKNIDGKLYFMYYAEAVAKNIDLIEKKPLYDFMPGTNTLTVATVGCNFCCEWCQNWEISQITKTDERSKALEMSTELTPKRVVKDALLNKCPSISYSYTEPTIFLEYALETMKLARKNGLKNIWVTNGYMTAKALDLILPYLDAANVDLKSCDDKKYQKFCCAKLAPILENLKKMHEHKVHLEITTLVVPDFNDKKSDLLKIAKFILEELGPETPWHITRAHPAYKMNFEPVTIELLNDIKHMAHVMRLKNIYLGNI